VKSDASLRDSQFCYFTSPLDGIEAAASSRHILKKGTKRYTTQTANSYATPVITSRVISYLHKNSALAFDDIKGALTKDAANISEKSEVYGGCNAGKNIGTPIILLVGFKFRKLREITRNLKQLFLENDYNCHIASNAVRAGAADFDFVPDNLEMLRYICDFWMCDVLLVGAKDKRELSYFDEISIIIKNDAAREENAVKEMANRAEIYLKDKNIDWLFETILRILT
jgi:hypothetical protein